MTIDRCRSISIERDYRPGIIGRYLELQALYYAKHAGFGRIFEVGRADDIAAFFRSEPNERSAYWSAIDQETIVGTIAVDAANLGENRAQLRWFIVDDCARGTGIGRRLLAEALAFCDQAGVAETHLWTFAGLDAARHLYEASDFVLVDEVSTDEWGPSVTKQHFARWRPERPTHGAI